MYLPSQFDENDQARACMLMRAHPLANLISNDDDGQPFVTPLPLHVQESGGAIQLLGHCAKANPHWRYLQARPNAVVTFMGPNAYMSPRVYQDVTRVPTWSYLMVRCNVQVKFLTGFEDKDRLLKHLIHEHDPAYADQWRSLGEDFQHRMMAGIVAFELSVTDLQCKFKLNQHRPESHAAMHGAYSNGNDNERALADWMVRLGLVVLPDAGFGK
jgi:transcriptional regulator